MSTNEKKVWTEEERLELAAKLDAELDNYINGLEKKLYREGWPEDKWQEEMEKHPFFMQASLKPGEELSPLMEGLQQLKYGEDENTPEELANNYKEDGNFNYKYKKYNLAILSYTEGIRIKCKDNDLMSQLYNNRAASQFMLKNYRSSLNDCKNALKLKSGYTKALNRAATCSFHIEDYDQCIDLCNQLLDHNPTDKAILKLKSQATIEKERLERDKRKQDKLEKRLVKQDERLLQIISQRGINIDWIDEQQKLKLKDLELYLPHVAESKVYLDENEKLVWPVIIFYPEKMVSDFVQNFHEDSLLIDQLREMFQEPSKWDKERRYNILTTNVYFENRAKGSLHKVDIQLTLGEIMHDKHFVVHAGTPTFLIFVKYSEAEKWYLQKHHYSPTTV